MELVNDTELAKINLGQSVAKTWQGGCRDNMLG